MKRYSGFMIVNFNNILSNDEGDLIEILQDNLGADVELDSIEINFEEDEPFIPGAI